MQSIPFNALFEASSMSFTHPPTTKLSKLFTPVFVCKPSTQNQKKSSPPFNKRSSSASLRLGHRCRRCGIIHSRVSCFPWSFIKVWSFVFNRCGINLCCVVLYCVVPCCVVLYGFINPSFMSIVSVTTSVEFGTTFVEFGNMGVYFIFFSWACLTCKMHPMCLCKCLN